MKIVMLGPAHPYRGGLATIMETFARTFKKMGHAATLKTFTLQYPSILFPGKTQTLDTEPPKDLDIERCVNSINPFNWIKVGLKLRKERPDFIVIKYWIPFLAPCFATIGRIAKSNGHTKLLCHVDNVEPHEHRIIDKPLNWYGLTAIDGFVYMSEQVNSELKSYSKAPAIFSPHPLFDNFGEKLPFEEACEAIGLDPKNRYALFFGLIRDYKGLDLLIEAWKKLMEEGKVQGKKLIVAGEFYAAREKYMQLIEQNQLQDEIILHDYFIENEKIKYFFSAADFLVQPYRTATQSGVTQIAYQFFLPMVVTNAGGLAEIVPHDRVGYVCETDVNAIADAIDKIWQNDHLATFVQNMVEERKRFSWEETCKKIMEVYDLCLKK